MQGPYVQMSSLRHPDCACWDCHICAEPALMELGCPCFHTGLRIRLAGLGLLDEPHDIDTPEESALKQRERYERRKEATACSETERSPSSSLSVPAVEPRSTGNER